MDHSSPLVLLEEQKERLSIMTTESEVDSVSSNVSLQSEDVSDTNSKKASAVNDPGQASVPSSQDSDDVDTKLTDTDCKTVVSDSTVRCDEEPRQLSSSKSEVDEEVNVENSENTGDDNETGSNLIKCSDDVDQKSLPPPKTGSDDEKWPSPEVGSKADQESTSLDSPKSEANNTEKKTQIAEKWPSPEVGSKADQESTFLDSPKSEANNTEKKTQIAEKWPSPEVGSKADQKSTSLDSPKSEANNTEKKMQIVDLSASANIQADTTKESQPNICSSGEETGKSSFESPLCASKSATTVKESEDDRSSPTKVSCLQTPSVPSKKKSFGGIRKPRGGGKTPISEMTPEMLEQLRFPFKHGWKREVVNRNVTDLGRKGQCDIYYFTPTGKKLRSMVEIDDWLNSNRSSPVQYKHFSFARMALFEPPSENVRDAGKPRNSSSLQPKEKQAPKTTPTMPLHKQSPRIKLSSFLPKPPDSSKITPKPVQVTESNGNSTKAPNQNQVAGHSVWPKRPLVKRTKYRGYSFLRKRRLSPEWKPWDEEDPKKPSLSTIEVVHPSKSPTADEDDLQSILGTPSKLISSIVNPSPPKPPVPSPYVQTSVPSVPPNVKVHILSKKDASTTDILAQLGLNSKNVRMVNFPPQQANLNLSANPSDSRIVYLPAGQRPFRPQGRVVNCPEYPTVNSNQPVLPRFRQLLPISPRQATSISPLSSSAANISIPPPPPLAIRPQFNRFSSNVTVLTSTFPPKLQFASVPSSILPDPPPLQMPLFRPGKSLLNGSHLSTTSTSSMPTLTPAASSSSTFLKNLANKAKTQNPVLTTALSNPPLSSMALNNTPPASLPYAFPLVPLGSSTQSLLNNSLSFSLDTSKETEGSRGTRDVTGYSNANKSNSGQDMTRIDPSSSCDRGLSTENLESRTEMVPDTDSKVNEDDQDFLLPISFGVSQPSLDGSEHEPDNSISRKQNAQEVVVSSSLSHLDIYCPVCPASSTNVRQISSSSVCDLDDKDNVFFKFPASHFRNVHRQKQIVLQLNGNEIPMTPGFIEVEGEDVKLKTSVKELKQWMVKQALKMKIRGGQKRKIILTASGQKSSYLRSFMLLQENYNIMMSIFKHLSIHDLLRACRVCKMWRRMALQKCLWRKLNLQQLGKINWIPAVNFFLNVDVRTLVMPEPYLSSQDRFETLNSIIDVLSKLTQLKELHFGIISQQMIDHILEKMPHLRNLGADFITDADPEIPSNAVPNTSSAEIAMAHAVELVLSGGFGVSEAAKMAGVLEADLAHLTQQNQGTLRKLEQDSVLLCCMRLSKMGFVIDETVIESRLEEIMKKRSSSAKMTKHTQQLICERMLRNNHHLFQTKLPYQKQDCLVQKLKTYASSLELLYNEVDLRSSHNVLAFVMKEFQVLNAAGNKMHRITALSVISPANLNLPVMLIFPVAVHYPESPPGLILISSKEGMATANLVMHYLRAVFLSVSTRPLIVFFNGHEKLISLDLVSECVKKCVLLHCLPKELSETIFPGNYGGVLHSLSKKIGKELVSETKFMDLISFHLKEDWWINWQGMCRAFQVTGIFPYSSSAAIGLYRSILSETLDSHLEGIELDCDDSSSSTSVLSSDEEVDEEETALKQSNESATKSESSPSTSEHDEQVTTQNQDEKCERESSPNEESPQGHATISCLAVDLKANETQSHLYSVPTTNIDQSKKRKRESTDTSDDDLKDEESVSENSDISESEDETLDKAGEQKLFIHIDEDEKENKNNSERESTDTSDDDIKDEESVSENSDISESEAETLDRADDQKLFIHIDEDEKENKNTGESPPRKKRKVEGPGKDMSSMDSIIKTIDSVIASSREYYDDCENRKTHTGPSSPKKVKKSEENKAQDKPSLKIKLFPKSTVSTLKIDLTKDQESLTKKDDVKSNVINLKENYRLHENTLAGEVSVEEEEEEEEEAANKEDEMLLENENNDASEMKETDEASAHPPSAKEEAFIDENQSDGELKVSSQLYAEESVHDKVTLDVSTSTRGKKKKKKRKKKKTTEGKENAVTGHNEENASFSKKKKKKKRKKKKSRKENEEDTNASRSEEEKELDEKTDVNTDEIKPENKDTEKSMMLMRRISLADHDYEAKFDSDSGHEMVEENVCEESRISETETLTKNDSQVEEHGPDSDKLPVQEDETSESSSDSDSNKQSGDGSSSSSSSSEDSSSETSTGDEEDGSESKKGVENESSESSESETDNDKDESSSSDDETSQSDEGNQPGAEKKENQADDSDSKSDGNQSEDEADMSDDDKEENQSDDEASSKADSNEDMYSEDDNDDDENMEDDDSKCQLCMSTNPPHSKDQIIDWVDCDSNCGRWFHVICINRSQSKANPKHFICPSCRCRR